MQTLEVYYPLYTAANEQCTHIGVLELSRVSVMSKLVGFGSHKLDTSIVGPVCYSSCDW